MGALAGDLRANAHYMEPNKDDVARRATACASAQELSCAERAWVVFVKKNMHCDLRFSHVCSLPNAAVELLSKSPHLHAKCELYLLS
jgi:hypothetical protein